MTHDFTILPLGDPTAAEIFDYTLDNAYEGQDSGDVAAPTGWFAMVLYPQNERWYIVSQDSDGFQYVTPAYASREAAKAEYDKLDEQYLAWSHNGLPVTRAEEARRESLGLGGGRHLEDYVLDDDGDELEPTCENGCPEGALGQHKFPCRWSHRWLYAGRPVKVFGGTARRVCIETGDGEHLHVSPSPTAQPRLARAPREGVARG